MPTGDGDAISDATELTNTIVDHASGRSATQVDAPPAASASAAAAASATSAVPACSSGSAGSSSVISARASTGDAVRDRMQQEDTVRSAHEETLRQWQHSLTGAEVCAKLESADASQLMAIAAAAGAEMRTQTVALLIVQSLVLVQCALISPLEVASRGQASPASALHSAYEGHLVQLKIKATRKRIEGVGTSSACWDALMTDGTRGRGRMRGGRSPGGLACCFLDWHRYRPPQ
jgi:hypothetical protein